MSNNDCTANNSKLLQRILLRSDLSICSLCLRIFEFLLWCLLLLRRVASFSCLVVISGRFENGTVVFSARCVEDNKLMTIRYIFHFRVHTCLARRR